MKKVVGVVLALMLAVSAAYAQEEQEEEAEPAQMQEAAQYAAVRVAHLVSGGSDFAVLLNGEAWIDSVGAGSKSGYKLVPAGEHQLELVAADEVDVREEEPVEAEAEQEEQEPAEEEPVEEEAAEEEAAEEEEPVEEEEPAERETLATHTLNLEAGAYYTVVVSGTAIDVDELREEEPEDAPEDEEAVPEEEEEPAVEEEAEEAEEAEVAEGETALTVSVEPEEATVQVAGPDGFEDTFTGSATLSGIPAGEYAVQATHEGFEPAEETIQVEEGEVVEVSLRLEAAEEVEEEPVEEEPAEEEPVEEGPVEEVDEEARYDVEIHVIHDDVRVPPAGMALVRIIHAGPEVPAVDVIALRDPEVDPEEPVDEPVEEEEPVEEPVEEEEPVDEPVEEPDEAEVEDRVPEQVREAVQEAQRAVHEDDDAQAALDDAISTTEQALGDAEGEVQSTLIQIHELLSEARQAAEEGDMEAAREHVDAAHALAEEGVAEPEAAEPVEEEPAEEPEEVEVEEEATLTVTVEPAEASVHVAGPDDFEQEFTGSQTLEGLTPGTYFVDATLRHYEAAGAEVELEDGASEEVTLTLERLEEAGPPPVEGDNIMPGLAYGTTSEYVALPYGVYTLQGQATDDEEGVAVYFELSEISLEPGVIYTFFAYGGPTADVVSIAVAVDGIFGQETDEEEPDEEPVDEEEVDEDEIEEEEIDEDEEEAENGG